MMKLTYQTGIAALIHLAVITLFNVVNGVNSGIQQCTNGSSDCIGNILTSMLYFMVTTAWFAALWIVATAAQTRRSRWLAILLVGGEFMTFVIASFNAHHHNNALGLTTSIVDLVLAIWVAFLASRIFIAGGGRVTGSARARRRRLSKV